jgi:hypothetical protein
VFVLLKSLLGVCSVLVYALPWFKFWLGHGVCVLFNTPLSPMPLMYSSSMQPVSSIYGIELSSGAKSRNPLLPLSTLMPTATSRNRMIT